MRALTSGDSNRGQVEHVDRGEGPQIRGRRSWTRFGAADFGDDPGVGSFERLKSGCQVIGVNLVIRAIDNQYALAGGTIEHAPTTVVGSHGIVAGRHFYDVLAGHLEKGLQASRDAFTWRERIDHDGGQLFDGGRRVFARSGNGLLPDTGLALHASRRLSLDFESSR